MEDKCELCEREETTSSHHLIPKQVHSKNWCKKKHTKGEMKNSRANLCRDCHPMVHQYFSHAELGKEYYTVDMLLTDEKVIKFVKFIKKQNKKAKR